MAGHRRGTSKLRRPDNRAAWHHAQVREAPTGRAQVSRAFDRARSAAINHPDAERELHALATWLDAEAQRLERRAA